MGRALWLRGSHDASLGELERAVDLSPNFALGHYALSFVQPSRATRRRRSGRRTIRGNLSPFDPLLFGMLGTRAMAHVRLGQFEEAAEWALKAAARPNAHIIILAIAAHCLALAGRVDEGRVVAADIRQDDAAILASTISSAPFTSRRTPRRCSGAARRIGLD